jgi:signal transduction histidine kinase
LRVELAPALPDVWVDASQVEQAVIEVVANALEAMPGGGALAVAARPRTPPGDRGVLELTIEDTGDGIAACDLPRVGEPFFTTKADGTGLGVAIAKRFVEQNQGQFVIASVGEKGTLVTISLPALPARGGAAG